MSDPVGAQPATSIQSFDDALRQVGEIDGLPQQSVRPLAALIHKTLGRMEARRVDVWGPTRRAVTKLAPVLDEAGESRTEAAGHVRALLASDQMRRPRKVRRIDFIEPAIAILRSCGCSLDDAAEFTSQMYRLVGWKPVYPSSVRSRFHVAASDEVRGQGNRHHDAVREEFERSADDFELYGRP